MIGLMKPKFTVLRALLAALVVVGLAALAWQFVPTERDEQATGIKVPLLSPAAQAGRIAFDANCARCHGILGRGTDHGPPLMHPIYNPGHHPDESFHYAARHGVQQHHWRFGNMPAQPQVTEEQLTQIVRYVRELQQANGIVYQEHRM